MAISTVKTPTAGTSAAVTAKPLAPESGKASANASGTGSPVAAPAATAVRSAAQGYTKTATAPTVKDAANVQISPRAKELSLARTLIEETPDVREDKVAEFRKRIASGEYKPDAGKIVDGILGEAIKDELSKKPEVALE
jgi:negative regulator of flagellin synthesis FlgM